MVNLQELRYFAAVAEHLHFGRAAEACHVSQPTLSGQLAKLEEQLGVRLFERTNKRVALTAAGEQILPHARLALEEAGAIAAIAQAGRDPMAAPFKLGVIQTLAPYLMPLLLGPLRQAYPNLTIELWEDMTRPLIEMLRGQRLDAALIATEVVEPDLTAVEVFDEPFLAALPKTHRLAGRKRIAESELTPDLLLLADGHCLAAQTLSACGGEAGGSKCFQAASLETLVSLVANGYGTTLVPRLAAAAFETREIVLRPLKGRAFRTIRLASRKTFPRQEALRALEREVRGVGMAGFEEQRIGR